MVFPKFPSLEMPIKYCQKCLRGEISCLPLPYATLLTNVYFCRILFPSRATGGELFRVIAIDPLSEEKAREVVHQIVDGVQHLHSLNIVHLDLKVRLAR